MSLPRLIPDRDMDSSQLSLLHYTSTNEIVFGNKVKTLTSVRYEFPEVEMEIDRAQLMPGKAHCLKSPKFDVSKRRGGPTWKAQLKLTLSEKDCSEQYGVYLMTGERVPSDTDIEANFSLAGGSGWTSYFTLLDGVDVGCGWGKSLTKEDVMRGLFPELQN